jgi:hypothetical protein
MELLKERRFDLVVTMVRIADIDVSAFARQVKQAFPKLPVVLLVFTEADLAELPGGVDPKVVDRVFVWTGDARILLSIIKLVEDSMNVEHDTTAAGVRVIIVVEDSARRYSSFLTFLYQELMAQSESLVAEGVNDRDGLARAAAGRQRVCAAQIGGPVARRGHRGRAGLALQRGDHAQVAVRVVRAQIKRAGAGDHAGVGQRGPGRAAAGD